MAEQLTVVRGHNVRDEHGNAFGMLDVHPDPSDVAVLLGVYVAAADDRVQLVLRVGTTAERHGLRIECTAISTEAPERIDLLVEPTS